jgi:alpha-galactosidase
MILSDDNVFYLTTKDTSYIFRVTKFGHLESVYYGCRIPQQDISSLLTKHTIMPGGNVAYDLSDDTYSLNTLTLEYSGIGKGDFRHSPLEVKMPDGTFVSDFTYQSHQIFDGYLESDTLPTAYGGTDECRTLEVRLTDKPNNVSLFLYYTVYKDTNVITRRTVLQNDNESPLVIRKLMSMSLDLPEGDYELLTLHGGWIKEAHKYTRPVTYGLYVNQSLTGASSNIANPGMMLYDKNTSENYGNVYGFNLVYSGNHYEAVERSSSSVRVMTGINPQCFEWRLEQSERFESPEAIMTFSDKGFNGASQNFHDFINRHIIRGDWKGKERPILLNSWEACFFDFTQSRLIRLARKAKALGVELFVLDDGWFGKRNNDRAGLGDYYVNRKKFPKGLGSFAEKINKLGMSFGVWFEPEMINEDSDLYRAHPEYAVSTPNRKPSYGRNQLVLDLCNQEVRNYIVENVRKVLESANIEYVKWDMNRHMTDMYSPSVKNQGEFYHRYIIGLYDMLKRIFHDKPHILLESCSSGGNRFDLGMLCFSPQVWTSDDTDPIERLKIQTGLSYFYPLSTMGAHVSATPHQQTLRNTPLPTRFNVSAFGVLGYELDLKYLNFSELKEIKKQISEYKKYRRVLQYGKFYRFDRRKPHQVNLLCVSGDQNTAIAGHFQTLSTAGDTSDILPLMGLDPDKKYILKTMEQTYSIRRFGALVSYAIPFKADPNGFLFRTANKFYRLPDAVEQYEGWGSVLEAGVKLNSQFIGSGYNKNIRIVGDYGSNLYIIKAEIEIKDRDV